VADKRNRVGRPFPADYSIAELHAIATKNPGMNGMKWMKHVDPARGRRIALALLSCGLFALWLLHGHARQPSAEDVAGLFSRGVLP
jgi:hypothetical protein